jgi:ribosomal protein S18 acetylase RimI-like enzyme
MDWGAANLGGWASPMSGGVRSPATRSSHSMPRVSATSPLRSSTGSPSWNNSLGWVCARQDQQLVGFVNVACDGSGHAFILDTVVAHTHRHRGVGTELVAVAAREAKAAGCEWLHVDFEDHLRRFYFGSCGFRPTNAGLLRLNGE